MGGIYDIEYAKSLGIKKAKYIEDGKYLAIPFDEWIKVVEEHRSRRNWSMEFASEMMSSNFAESSKSNSIPTDEAISRSEPEVSKPKKHVRENVIFDANSIVVKRVG